MDLLHVHQSRCACNAQASHELPVLVPDLGKHTVGPHGLLHYKEAKDVLEYLIWEGAHAIYPGGEGQRHHQTPIVWSHLLCCA